MKKDAYWKQQEKKNVEISINRGERTIIFQRAAMAPRVRTLLHNWQTRTGFCRLNFMIGSSLTEHRLHKTRPQWRLKTLSGMTTPLSVRKNIEWFSPYQWCLRLVIVNLTPHSKHVSLSPQGGSLVMISNRVINDQLHIISDRRWSFQHLPRIFTNKARLAAGTVNIDKDSLLQMLKLAPAVTNARHNWPWPFL